MRTATRRATVYGGRRAGNGLLNNLVAYWPLNEAAGANNALDLHSNALHLTQNSSPGSAAGKVYAGARTFDGSADYFSRASESLLQTGDVDYTIAAWVYLTAKPTFAAVLYKTNTYSEYQLDYHGASDRWRFGFALEEGGTFLSALANNYGSPATDVWTLLVCWYNAAADTLNLSVNNGTTDATESVAATTVGAAALTLGSYGATRYFPGRIGPVAMWKSAAGQGAVLSEAQRAAAWNGGAGLPYASFTA